MARAAARAFEGAGAVVEEVTPGFADTREIIRCMWNVHEAGNFGEYLAEFRDRMDPGLVAAIEDGLRYSGADYVAMRGRKLAYWDSVRPLFETYDLLLTPTVSVAAFDVGRLNPEGLARPSVGLVRLGLVQLPVQLHRAARLHRPRRLHARRACPSACRSSAGRGPTSPCSRPRAPSSWRAPGRRGGRRSIEVGGPEMAPHTPHARNRPCGAGAVLDPPTLADSSAHAGSVTRAGAARRGRWRRGRGARQRR